MHSDMKVIQQLLMDDAHGANDASNKDGSSVLGKYIIGAKNNFRGFNSRQEDKNTPLKVTVHHGEEETDKDKSPTDTKQESDAQQSQVDECGTEGLKQVTDCDVVKMEEGRATGEQGDNKENEKKEQVEAVKSEISDNKVKEEVVPGTSFNNAAEKVKAESSQEEAGKKGELEVLTGVEVGNKRTETTLEPAETTKVNTENTETKSASNKVKDTELQENKAGPKWMKGRKFEQNVGVKSGTKESNEKPGTKKIIPSPTGSSTSQDTGFGSQEGEGSIDGILVRP